MIAFPVVLNNPRLQGNYYFELTKIQFAFISLRAFHPEFKYLIKYSKAVSAEFKVDVCHWLILHGRHAHVTQKPNVARVL